MTSPSSLLARGRAVLPRGQTLPADAWERRHRWMLILLWAHAVALPLYGLATGYGLFHSAGHAIALIGAGLLAVAPVDRRARSCAVAMGLLTASALAVHVSGGLTVAHFHFFVMIPVLALYEDWLPFLLALGYVVVHHGLGGVIEPHQVYDNADAIAHPWKWAAIHAAFVLAASAASVTTWRLNEDVRLQSIREREHADALARRRAEQQSHVAAIAELAFGGEALEDLFTESITRVGAGLGVPHVSLLEQLPDGGARRIGPDGVAEGPVGVGSPALAFALDSGEPVVVGDVASETRFDTTELEAKGIAAGLSVVVTDQGGRKFGVIAAYSDVPVDFTGDDVHFVQALAGILGGAIHRERSDHELRYQSLHDPLTGLPNRLLFVDRVQQALARAQRSKETVAVVLLDLDQFKLVNDSLSHDAGDALLREIAQRLDQHVRGNDTLARFGGDEFAVLCEGLDGTGEALLVAERMRALFAEPCTVEGRSHVVSASIGVAVSNGSYLGRHEELVRDADAAMHRAKSAGRDRCELFDEDIRADVLRRLNTETALRRALVNDELRLHFQPLVSLADDGIAHCEALVRWQDPERGLVPPGEFIPVAEDSGLIIPIGEWVLDEACRQAVAWGETVVAVNISAIQLGHPGFVATVADALRRHALSPSRLILEVTETALIEDPDGAARTLRALAELGVCIALDDFGTGYSSLSSLKRYPLAMIKLDRSFIADLSPGTADAAIVGSVVAMARSLELSTVAEGVETEQQRDHLRELGCEIAQGFLYSRPVPADEFARLLVRFPVSPREGPQ